MTINGCSWWCLVALCQPGSCVFSHTRAICLVHSRNQSWWHRHLTHNPMPLTFGQRMSGTILLDLETSHKHRNTHRNKQMSKTRKNPFNHFPCAVKAEKSIKQIFAMLLWILSWTKCSLQKSIRKQAKIKSVLEKGTCIVFDRNATGGWFQIQSGRRFRQKKATEEESVPSSVTEQMRSKTRDLGGIRLQTAQGNSPAAPERDAGIQKRTSEWPNSNREGVRDRKREKERELAQERDREVEKAMETHRNTKKSVERPEKWMLVFFKQLYSLLYIIHFIYIYILYISYIHLIYILYTLSVLCRNVRIGQHK